jgi:hypothetical protein
VRLGLDGVDVKLSTKVSAEDLRGFDVVVVAAGVTPRELTIPGCDHPAVLSFVATNFVLLSFVATDFVVLKIAFLHVQNDPLTLSLRLIPKLNGFVVTFLQSYNGFVVTFQQLNNGFVVTSQQSYNEPVVF